MSSIPTSISVSAARAAPVSGQTETFKATVTASSGDPTPTASDGTVRFHDGATRLGTAKLVRLAKIEKLAELAYIWGLPAEFVYRSTFTAPGHDHHAPLPLRHAIVSSGAQLARVPSVTYYNAANTTDAGQFPISAWQGIKAGDTPGQYLISGTSAAMGILYVGAINGQGTSYPVNFPGASQTSVYGVNGLGGNRVQLVGSYVNPGSSTRHGFFFQGTYGDGGVTGTFSTLDVPGATFNYIHSTMGGLAVGNFDGPTASGLPLGPGTANVYNVSTGQVVANVKFPGSVSNTAYGIWYNGGTSFTIVGGFSKRSMNNMNNQESPIGTGYIVDYNSATGRFSHWKALTYPRGFNFVTHFEGISSTQPGVYQLAATSIQVGSRHITQGSWVVLRRNRNGTFGSSSWVNLNYPGVVGLTTDDSVAGNTAVGIAIGTTAGRSPIQLSYQATVNVGRLRVRPGHS